MYLLGVLCLISAAVALPSPTQLHTNLPAPPPPPELKSEEKGKSSGELADKPQPALQDPDSNSDGPAVHPDLSPIPTRPPSIHPSESAEKPKAEKDEDDKNKPDDVKHVVEKESKEEEPQDSKDKPKNSKESEESKKEPTSEESMDSELDDGPIVVQVVGRPSWMDFISHWFPQFQWPQFPWPNFMRPNNITPARIGRESELLGREDEPDETFQPNRPMIFFGESDLD